MSRGNIGWSASDLELLDDFLMGFTEIESQSDLADLLGKSLNSVKIRISRRKKELGGIKKEEMRKLTIEEYLIVLSNRFDKNTEYIASIIGVTSDYLEDEMDEIDCLECSEHLEKDFSEREITIDELIVLNRLLKKGRGELQISHILNRPISTIRRLLTQ